MYEKKESAPYAGHRLATSSLRKYTATFFKNRGYIRGGPIESCSHL